jgi:malonyl-CoA O-methyltransferase
MIPQSFKPEEIIDVGCGTGALVEILNKHFNAAKITGLDIASGMINTCKEKWADLTNISFEIGDGENFKLPKLPNLIVSTYAMQWFQNISSTISCWSENVCRRGKIAFATPVEGSFIELQKAYKEALGKNFKGLNLKTPEQYEQATKEAGLKIIANEKRPITAKFDSAIDALRSFKMIGATFNRQPDYLPLTRREIKKLCNYYEEKFSDINQKVIVTYNTLFLVAEKI